MKLETLTLNGKTYDSFAVSEADKQEIAEMEANKPNIPYEQRVVARIRERYSVDDELAILRQRDTKPDEFAEYNEYVEQVKAEEKQCK